MSPNELLEMKINKLTWSGRGGFDGFKCYANNGMESFYCGYPEKSTWRPGLAAI
jgi:hypothetical protein